MSTERGPKRFQYWYCETCCDDRVHTVPHNGSCHLQRNVYLRAHYCNICNSKVETYEEPKSVRQRMLQEAKEVGNRLTEVREENMKLRIENNKLREQLRLMQYQASKQGE